MNIVSRVHDGFMAPGTRRRLIAAIAVAALAATTALVAVIGIGTAQSSTGGFEIDGNTSGANDWDGVSPQLSVNDGGSMFKPGQTAKEDNWQNWTIRTKENVPPKDDFGTVQAYTTADQGEDSWLYVNFDRAKGVGDANVGFEFNQAGGFPPNRQPGDLLLNYKYGGNTATLEAFRWDGNNWVVPAGVTTAAAISGDRRFGEGAVNLTQFLNQTGGSLDPCEPFANVHVRSRSSGSTKPGAPQNQREAQLKDLVGPLALSTDLCGAVDFVKADEDGDPLGAEGNGAVFALYSDQAATQEIARCTTANDGTCTIDDLTAGTYYARELQAPPGFEADPNVHEVVVPADDRVTVTVNNDEIPTPTFDITIAPTDAENLVDTNHGLTVTLTRTFEGTTTGVAGATPTVTKLSGPGSIVPGTNTCATQGTDNQGECTLEITSSTVGQTVMEATFDGQAGNVTVPAVQTDPDASKDWVDYAIDVTPPDAVNPVGTDHTFTVDLTRFDPDNLSGTAAGSQDVDLALSGVGEIIAVNGASVAGGPTSTTCTTDANGQCTVTIHSDTDGAATLTATYQASVAGVTRDFEDSGDKDFVEPGYQIRIEPLDDDNLVDNPHELTVSVFEVTNSGNVPTAGVNPAVAIADGVGSITDDNCATDGTDADGECTVTITSSQTGRSVVTASFDGQIAGAPVDIQVPDDANKNWVDYAIDVSPDDALNPLGEPHEFTVSLERTEGSDSNPNDSLTTVAAGETVEVTLTGEGEISAIPSGSIASDGRSGTCTTDSAGECAVTIVSDTVGSSTLTATYGAVVGDTEADFAADGDKEWVESGYNIRLRPVEDDNLVGNDHELTVTVTEVANDGTITPVEGIEPQVEILSGPGQLEATTCTTDADGQCTVTLTSDETGQTVLRAIFDGEIDQDEVDLVSNDAVKNWVDYDLDVSPPSDVNATGDDHVFTVSLDRSDEDGTNPAAGESIVIDLDGLGEITDITDGTINSDAVSGTCVTDADGECEVTITSDQAGDSTLFATYSAEVGQTTGTFSDSGDKEWRAPGIQIVKNAEITPNEEDDKVINCDLGVCPDTTFTFTVSNTADVTLDDITLTDDQFGNLTDELQAQLADLTLEPGENEVVEVTYTPSAADIAAGIHTNVATVTGDTPDDQTLTDTDDETVLIVDVGGEQEDRAAIRVVKIAQIQADDNGDKIVTCTDDGCPSVTYTFEVTNTGEASLSEVTVVDAAANFAFGEITLEDTTLSAGESTMGTATLTGDQVETLIDRGFHFNIATATGAPPEGPPVSDDDDERVEIAQVFDEPPTDQPPQGQPPAAGPTRHPRTGPGNLSWLLVGATTALLAGTGLVLGDRRRRWMT